MTLLVPSRSEEVRLIGQCERTSCPSRHRPRARSDAKVLITGETGVGKEVVSASSIIEAQGFSAARDAQLRWPPARPRIGIVWARPRQFHSAYRDKPGLLEMAPNGTVSDEVGRWHPHAGVLLRFLETGEIQRIGSN